MLGCEPQDLSVPGFFIPIYEIKAREILRVYPGLPDFGWIAHITSADPVSLDTVNSNDHIYRVITADVLPQKLMVHFERGGSVATSDLKVWGVKHFPGARLSPLQAMCNLFQHASHINPTKSMRIRTYHFLYFVAIAH